MLNEIYRDYAIIIGILFMSGWCIPAGLKIGIRLIKYGFVGKIKK